MSLFNLFRKKQSRENPPSHSILLAMPLFNEGKRYSLRAVTDHLTGFWGLKLGEVTGNDDSAVLGLEGQQIALAFMPVPVPWADIEATAQYAYNWPGAADGLRNHTGHAIVSVMGSEAAPLTRYQLLSKVLCSILATSGAAGVYQGSQSLLIPAKQYLSYQDDLKQGRVAVPLWVYIGLRKTETRNHAYTYGLSAFGKQEMEILNTQLPLDELYDFLANISAYIIENDITFKNGETLGYTAEQKVRISSSKGRWVEGETFKLEM